MAIVITDGLHYIRYNEHGGTRTTQKIDNAFQFENASDAINAMHKAQSKTKYYYVYDTATQRIVWRWMSQEEVERLKAEKRSRNEIKRTANGKIKKKNIFAGCKTAALYECWWEMCIVWKRVVI